MTKTSKTQGTEAMAARIRAALEPSGPEVLSPARRRAVLADAGRPRRTGWLSIPALRPSWALAAAAALVAVMVAPLAFRGVGPAPAVSEMAPAAVPVSVEGLEVLSDGDHVVLRWKASGSGSYRVIRATDPRQLAAGEGEVIRGTTWTDPERNGSAVVFYRVEQLAG